MGGGGWYGGLFGSKALSGLSGIRLLFLFYPIQHHFFLLLLLLYSSDY
jgi:hypothetical protein